MRLFLSYADEDGEIAREIAARLSSANVSIYSPQDAASESGSMVLERERAIQQADAFLALLSPYSLTSAPCRRDRQLAFRQERRHRNNRGFVRVIQVRETPYHQAGWLHSRPWLDLTGPVGKERVLSDLAGKFQPSAGPPSSGGNRPSPNGGGGLRRPPQLFRNREPELEEIKIAINRDYGERFWLIIAPPQLGKSWFLEELAKRIDRDWHGRWAINQVDARELSPEAVGDADMILRMMFGLDPHAGTDRPIVESIAAILSGNYRRQLCLLDSAELLDNATVRQLRGYLSEIHRRIAGSGTNSDLALIAASRRDNAAWKNVSPRPRVQIRVLTEFKVEVIQDALGNLAPRLGHSSVTAEMEQLAQRVHRLSEGLPALLDGYLNWIQERGWTGLEQLEGQATFEEIAQPYAETELLSPRSLGGTGSMPTDDEHAAVEQALRALSPYRLFTESHLSRHAAHGALRTAIDRLNWPVHRLWEAVSGIDLLYRPQKEPWLAIYDPIRRLLFRHWHPAKENRILTHIDARNFLRSFFDDQSGRPEPSGTDECRVLVECLWHQAQILILERSADMEDVLLGLAAELAARLVPGRIFDLRTLRSHAALIIQDDEELENALSSVPGLFDQLVETVGPPT